jgi:hypothetical protein
LELKRHSPKFEIDYSRAASGYSSGGYVYYALHEHYTGHRK